MLAECFQTMLYSLETTLKIDNRLSSYSLYTKFETSLHTLDCAYGLFPNGLSYSLYFDIWTRNGVFFYIFPHQLKLTSLVPPERYPLLHYQCGQICYPQKPILPLPWKLLGSTFYAKPKEGHQFGPTRWSSQSNSTKACATRLSPARYWSFTPSWWESQCGVKRSGICRFNSGWGISAQWKGEFFVLEGPGDPSFFFSNFGRFQAETLPYYCKVMLSKPHQLTWVSPGLGRGSWSITKRGN